MKDTSSTYQRLLAQGQQYATALPHANVRTAVASATYNQQASCTVQRQHMPFQGAVLHAYHY